LGGGEPVSERNEDDGSDEIAEEMDEIVFEVWSRAK